MDERIEPRSRFAETRKFLREWMRDPLQTGAIVPSGAALAREVAFAAAIRPGSRVVELGPGTGVFTDQLVRAGIAEENLTLVELNPEFGRLLTQRFPKATLVSQDALAALVDLADRNFSACAVISGLPLLVYPRTYREAICDTALRLVGHHGRFVQFTYSISSPVPRRPHIRATPSRRIWNNLPPAMVWTYQSGDAG